MLKPDPTRLIQQGYDPEDVDDMLDDAEIAERRRDKRKRPEKEYNEKRKEQS